MLVMVSIISALVILLVLFLLIRSLVFSKRKDYGIYKAIGYTSKSLILQTAGSFMPTIILSVIVFSVASYFGANPYMQFIMISFGLMKCSFSIPIPGVIIVGASMIILSFVFAVLQARRVRKIEPYQMLIAE
jgi:ABC-type antimicrobial peptide transport system permease subunit